jgi:hypothetical protein
MGGREVAFSPAPISRTVALSQHRWRVADVSRPHASLAWNRAPDDDVPKLGLRGRVYPVEGNTSWRGFTTSGWGPGSIACGHHQSGHASSASRASASFRSGVSKPSVNQP